MEKSYELEHAEITSVFGATGSGKTHIIKRLIAGDQRLLVWDYKREYKGEAISSIPDLIEAVKRPRFRISFHCTHDDDEILEQFNAFCQVAFMAGNLRLVPDELWRVTNPWKAPMHWRECTNMGRARGLRILCGSIRPGRIDLDMIANANRVFAGRTKTPGDVKALEAVFEKHARMLPRLPDRQFLYWSVTDPLNVTLLRN